jgi:formylglycine-generating enzyme required for sulfatase activity
MNTKKNTYKNTYNRTGTAALRATLAALALAMTGERAFGADVGTDYLTDPSLMVRVGDINNLADPATGSLYGSVSYEYSIGKYEVTNAQYAAFLNAVDSTGTNTLSLYSNYMDSDVYGGIKLISGNEAGSKYEVKPGYANKPVNHVSFWDAARFVNWLSTGDTENGVYVLGGVMNPESSSITRNEAAWAAGGFAIASEDEWYKAAYYNGNGSYRTYPVTGELSQETANYFDDENFAIPNGSLGDGDHLADVNHYNMVDGASSFYGTYQQGGNVWEWGDTIISDTSRRRVYGGSFTGEDENFISSAYVSNVPTTEAYLLGFRVVSLTSLTAVPEPGTWAAAAGLITFVFGMWVRRGRRIGRG